MDSKTKDEVLEENGVEWCFEIDIIKEDVHNSMDEWAKIVSIDFSKWKDKNWNKSIGDMFTHTYGDLVYKGLHSYEQIFDIYLNSKK